VSRCGIGQNPEFRIRNPEAKGAAADSSIQRRFRSSKLIVLVFVVVLVLDASQRSADRTARQCRNDFVSLVQDPKFWIPLNRLAVKCQEGALIVLAGLAHAIDHLLGPARLVLLGLT
jgi:hypothetical protein